MALKKFNVNGVEFNMIHVEGGTFNMGTTIEQDKDARSDESPIHKVTLSDYYIGETAVTQELWKAVMNTTILQLAAADGLDKDELGCIGENFPMYYLTWYNCQKFIEKLNKITGENFRLPTEAEWEFAAKGGNKSKGYKYSGGNDLKEVAWYERNAFIGKYYESFCPIKHKKPNELGIYDMSGSVWEWCQDWYDENYYSYSPKVNPTGPLDGVNKVCRGGDWGDDVRLLRLTCRSGDDPDYTDSLGCNGFRLVLNIN